MLLRTTKHQGFILLIVLAILGILAAMAIMLAWQSSCSHRLSADFKDRVGARLAARSGFEKYLTLSSNLPFYEPPPSPEADSTYFGEDLNADGELRILAGLQYINGTGHYMFK